MFSVLVSGFRICASSSSVPLSSISLACSNPISSVSFPVSIIFLCWLYCVVSGGLWSAILPNANSFFMCFFLSVRIDVSLFTCSFLRFCCVFSQFSRSPNSVRVVLLANRPVGLCCCLSYTDPRNHRILTVSKTSPL